MKHNSSVSIIANSSKNFKDNLAFNNKFNNIFTYDAQIQADFGVSTSDLTVKQHLNAIAQIKSQKKSEFLDSKELYSLQNSINKIPLRAVAEQTHQRNASFFYNKMNTVYELSKDYGFSQTFITLTSLRTKKDIKDLEKLALTNKQINADFNEFFRTLFKKNIFKKHLTKQERFYIKSNEFTKRNFLHTHFLLLLNPEFFMQFLEAFESTFTEHAKALKIGRTEIVVPKYIFNRLRGNPLLKTARLNKENVLVLDKEKEESFFYIKTLKENKKDENEIDESVLKYATKYVYKNFKDKLDNFDNMSETDAMYSITRIRRINFSRFTFPQYLFHGLKNADGEGIFTKYKLTELSHLYNTKQTQSILKKNVNFKDIKAEYRDLLESNNNIYDIEDNLCLWTLCTGTKEQKDADRISTLYYQRKRTLKAFDKINNFDELSDFLLNEFEIDEEFNEDGFKYTLTSESETIANKYLDYMLINGEKWFLDTSIKFILMDKAE